MGKPHKSLSDDEFFDYDEEELKGIIEQLGSYKEHEPWRRKQKWEIRLPAPCVG